MDTVLVETYFDWLESEAFNTKTDRTRYRGVMRALHDIPFYWTVVSDDNRAGDAVTFRQYEFLQFQDGLEDMDQVVLGQWATAAPSVLEVLLGIARRWAFFFEGEVWVFFWHLFANMGFNRFPGQRLTGGTKELIRNKCDIWMSRQFNANGYGSPFHIHQTFDRFDMREVDIWGQMNAYSAEHFQ